MWKVPITDSHHNMKITYHCNFSRNFTVENLRFLNVDQALADLAYFIRDYVRAQPRFADSKIIMYGGSYAANMALWFKQRYPHLAVGVVASSGPIKAQIDFTGKPYLTFLSCF